jgi:DNA-binding CsgD family transcriptional regulator
MVRLTRFELGDYQKLIQVQRWSFMVFMFATYISAYLLVMFYSSKLTEKLDRNFIRVFGSWYLAFVILSMTPLILSEFHSLFRQLFLLFFLSWHLIPILFLNIYLNRCRKPAYELPEDFEMRLEAFAAQHEISKRECEVVRLICQGLANQEISDTLFISLQTVKDHIHRIFVKTGVKNRVQLTNMIR